MIRLTYIGGPTALIEWRGLRLMTDPTLDPPGDYPTPAYTLTKTHGPAVAIDAIGAIDAVLLSHDHHFDNLDHAGKLILAGAERVLTTVAGAERLGGNAIGIAPWASIVLTAPDGATLRITATPARHGPENGDRGPVIGFILCADDEPDNAVYISGDTVWYDGVRQVSERFAVRIAVLFMGAAHVAAAGPSHLTFTADEAVEAARAFGSAAIVPLHFEGWQHFAESRADVEAAFRKAGLAQRLRWPTPGSAMNISV